MAKKKKSIISIKTQLLVATGTVLILVIFGLFVGWLDNNMDNNLAGKTNTVSFKDVTIKGETVCIAPFSRDGAQPAVCAIGLKTESGLIYALGSDTSLAVDTRVELTGTVSSVSKDETRNLAGILTVK